MAFALLEVWTLFDLLLAKVLSGVTPAAKRNTYSVAILVGYLTQGSVLSPATLGCVIATPTELPRVRTIHDGLTIITHNCIPSPIVKQ